MDRVVFVKSVNHYTKETEITAVFPDIPWTTGSADMVTSYTHNGQHSSCSLTWAKEQPVAEPSEYRELLDELIRVGYDRDKLIVRDYFYEKRLDEIDELLHRNHDEIHQYLNFDTDDKVWALIDERIKLVLEQVDITGHNCPF